MTTNRNLRATLASLARCALVLPLLGGAVLSGVTISGCSHGRFGNMMSTSQEIELGRQYSQQVEKQSKMITSGPQYDQLQRVAARILPEVRQQYDVPYSVKLIDSKEVNAFSLPGGPIYFYKGLMDITDDDDQVAAVLGHEATHIVKRHVAKQISDAQAKDLLAQLLLGRAGNAVQALAGLGLQIDQLRFSREDEHQADVGGFRDLIGAGYDPDAMAQMFQHLKEKEGRSGGGPEWLQNHPLTAKRIQDAQTWAAAYKQNGTLPS